MSTLFCYLAIEDGKPKRSALEVLSRCRALANSYGHEVACLVASSPMASGVDAARRHGADRILTLESADLVPMRNDVLLELLAEGVRQTDPIVVAMASTEASKDILGALAVRLDAGVVSDVGAFALTSNGVEALRPVMAAKYLSRVDVQGPRVLVSVRAGSYDAIEATGKGHVEDLQWTPSETPIHAQIRDVVRAVAGTVDLSEAQVVVAAGRGVKDEAGKALVDELAGLLNGAVGSSRAVVETGLFPASSQIGQTGKVVSPTVYFAVGISGAIQHVAGMLNSKVIVAINKDPDAPIFEYATFGLVGDLYSLLPLIIEEITRLKAST